MALIQITAYLRNKEAKDTWDRLANKTEWLHQKLLEEYKTPAEKPRSASTPEQMQDIIDDISYGPMEE